MFTRAIQKLDKRFTQRSGALGNQPKETPSFMPFTRAASMLNHVDSDAEKFKA